MYQTNLDYIKAAMAPSRTLQARVLFDGWENYIEADGLITLKFEEMFNPDTARMVMGAFCSNKLTIEMLRPAALETGLMGAALTAQVALEVGGEPVWVPLGRFYVFEVSAKNEGILTLTCYDQGAKLTGDYIPRTNGGGSFAAAEIVADIAVQYGFEVAPCDFSYTPAAPLSPEAAEAQNEALPLQLALGANAYPVKELLGCIAGLMGKNARFDREGRLEFVWYDYASYTAPNAESATLYLDENSVFLDGCESGAAGNGEEGTPFCIASITSGTAESPITVGAGYGISFENPFMTEEILQAIFARVGGMEFTPATLKFRGIPTLMGGDIVRFGERDFFVMAQEMLFDGGMSAVITTHGEQNPSFALESSPTAKRIEKLYTGLSDAFAKATERMVGKGGGYFSLEYDENALPCGWKIMDTPTLTPTTKLWKMTSAGLAHSVDGGRTYKDFALTATGKLAANAIAAGSIDAACINVGSEEAGTDETTLDSFFKVRPITFTDEKGTESLKTAIILGAQDAQVALIQLNDRLAFVRPQAGWQSVEAGQILAYFDAKSFAISTVSEIRLGGLSIYPRSNGNYTFSKNNFSEEQN